MTGNAVTQAVEGPRHLCGFAAQGRASSPAWLDPCLDAPTDERIDGNSRIPCVAALHAVRLRGQPQCQAVDAAARVRIADIGKGEVAGKIVPRTPESVTVQDGRRLPMHALVAAEHRLLEEGGHCGNPSARDSWIQTQPCHDCPAVRHVLDSRRPVRRPVQERWKLRPRHRRTPFLPGVVHAVQHRNVTGARNTDPDVPRRIRHEDLVRRTARQRGRHAHAHRGIRRAEVAHPAPRDALSNRGCPLPAPRCPTGTPPWGFWRRSVRLVGAERPHGPDIPGASCAISRRVATTNRDWSTWCHGSSWAWIAGAGSPSSQMSSWPSVTREACRVPSAATRAANSRVGDGGHSPRVNPPVTAVPSGSPRKVPCRNSTLIASINRVRARSNGLPR